MGKFVEVINVLDSGRAGLCRRRAGLCRRSGIPQRSDLAAEVVVELRIKNEDAHISTYARWLVDPRALIFDEGVPAVAEAKGGSGGTESVGAVLRSAFVRELLGVVQPYGVKWKKALTGRACPTRRPCAHKTSACN